MRTIRSDKSLILALFFLPLALLAHDGKLNGKYTKEKTIKKEYRVNPDALLKIDNSYGSLTLSSWNENRVVIEVQIKTSGNNEDKVQDKLDEITVDFDASTSMVSAKTNFDSKRGWSWNWGRNNNVDMQVNYTIKLPVKNSINLSNDYGNITLDRLDGHAKISCDYGRLEIGELHGRNNQLNFDYTSKSNFGYINSASINADYSGFTVERAGDLSITADYTNATIIKTDNLNYTNDYGSLEVEEVGNVQGRGDYINTKLGTVHGNVDIAADYGSLEVRKMAADAGNLNIQTDYTGIKFGYAAQYNFDFEISTDYAGVDGRENLEINISEEKGSKRYYKGYHGQARSGRMVSIRSDYGGISLKRVE